MIYKIPYIFVYRQGIARHPDTFKVYPPGSLVEVPIR